MCLMFWDLEMDFSGYSEGRKCNIWRAETKLRIREIFVMYIDFGQILVVVHPRVQICHTNRHTAQNTRPAM